MMIKYQSVEETKVLTPEEHKRVSNTLSRYGKISMKELTDEQREELTRSLQHSD